MNLFRFPNKQIRAQAIKDYMNANGINKAVCFSCGNASKSLKDVGVEVLDISPRGDLQPLRWFTQGEIKTTFPDRLDTTSGHLPMELMILIGQYFKDYLKELPEEINLPTGSGETLVELKLAFPDAKINAIYNLDSATEYSDQAPLNALVKLLANKVINI